MGSPALLAEDLWKRFGGVEALRGVHLEVKEGEILGIIGPNGAGKTVLLNVVNGIYSPDRGRVMLNGFDITGLPSHLIARMGVSRTFQITKMFQAMTVLENVFVPLHALRKDLSRQQKTRLAFEALELVGLADIASSEAKSLSGGQKKLLELARGIAPKPNVYLMDEPFAGVNPILLGIVLKAMKSLADEGKTIVLVSHELGIVSKVCGRVAVLDRGEKIAEGPIKEVATLPQVRWAYLGE